MTKNIKTAIFFILFCVIAVCNSYSQSITKDKLIGVWQADDSIVGSCYLDNYKFFKNGRFEFEPSETEGLRRIEYFRGNYEIVLDTLKLSPDSIAEMVGGTPEISHTYIGNGWDMENGSTVKKRKLKKASTTELSISAWNTDEINRTVPSNVKYNLNYYEKHDQNGMVDISGSHGDKNTAEDPKKTLVGNIDKTSLDSHTSIDDNTINESTNDAEQTLTSPRK